MKNYSKQYRNLATIITGVGLTFFSITAEAETIGYEQSPGHYLGGFQSDGELVTVADEFQLDQSALIRNITWWGGYLDSIDFPPPVADDVNIRLYADQGGWADGSGATHEGASAGFGFSTDPAWELTVLHS